MLPIGNKQQTGFTLIEILVALMIFAIMATITALSLSASFSTQQRLTAHAKQLASLQMSYHLLNQDLSHLVAKPMYAQNHRALGSFIGNLKQFTFTRAAYYPAAAKTSPQLQRITYVLKDQQLFRQIINASNQIAKQTILLKAITSYKIQYLDDKHYWHDKWFDWHRHTIPQAIRLDLELKQLGTLTWLIRIPRHELIPLSN